MPKPRDLKSENIGSMPQRSAYSRVRKVAGFFGHGDDPGLGMARIMDDADVGPRPPAGELDVFQVVDPVPGALSGQRLVGAVEHDEVARQPQAIIPFAFLRSDRPCRRSGRPSA